MLQLVILPEIPEHRDAGMQELQHHSQAAFHLPWLRLQQSWAVRAVSPLHRGEGRHCAEKAKVQAVGMSQANSSLGPLIFIVLSLP